MIVPYSLFLAGVESHCLDRENRFGYSIGQPCIYLHIAKVFDWTASLINSSLAEATGLPFNCTFSSDVDMDLVSPTLDSLIKDILSIRTLSWVPNTHFIFRPPKEGLSYSWKFSIFQEFHTQILSIEKHS